MVTGVTTLKIFVTEHICMILIIYFKCRRMEGPLQFLQSFPFGKELVQQFDQHDLLTGEVEGSMPLLVRLWPLKHGFLN